MMQLQLLEGHPRAHWLQGLDPRGRLLLAGAIALTAVSLDTLFSLGVLLLSLGIAAVALGMPVGQLLRRLLALEGFMLLVVLWYPFALPGTPLFQWGPLTLTDLGLLHAVTILLKANCVVLGLLILVGTLEPVVLGHALARLRLSPKLVQLLLFTLRYIHVLFDEFQRLRLAMRARAFRPANNRHSWRSLGWLMGMLLLRSFQRAQRIDAAMRCRGFRQQFHLFDNLRWRPRDSALLLGAMALLIALLVLEYRP